MNNIEYAWVIQRDDGLFLTGDFNGGYRISDCLMITEMFAEKICAEYAIEYNHLQNCKPVKVKIEVVEDVD